MPFLTVDIDSLPAEKKIRAQKMVFKFIKDQLPKEDPEATPPVLAPVYTDITNNHVKLFIQNWLRDMVMNYELRQNQITFVPTDF